MTLNPQAAALLQQGAESGAPTLDAGTPDEGRAVFLAMTGQVGLPPVEVAQIREIQIPGPNGDIRSLVITPNNAGDGPLPVLIYYHGGGWVIGCPESHNSETRFYADAAKCVVVVPDYRLSPEHKFPAAPEDCYAVLEWVAANGDAINGDPSRIAVGGDSAGGNLSAVVAQMTRERGGPAISLQVLVYPATDMSQDSESYESNKDGYFLTGEMMAWFRKHYLLGPSDIKDTRASPLLAQDFSGLAPALVMTAGYDPLRDEGDAYADRLKSAGVAVEHIKYPGQIHGFVSMAGVIDEGREFLERAAKALRQAFGN